MASMLKNTLTHFWMPFVCIALLIYIPIVFAADLSIDNKIASTEIGVAPNNAIVSLSVKDFHEPIYDVQWYYNIPNGVNLSNLTEPVNIAFVNGDKLLTWNIGNMSPNQTKRLVFNVSSEVPGQYTFGGSPSSAITYIRGNGTKSTQAAPIIAIYVNGDVSKNASTNINSEVPLIENIGGSFMLSGQGRGGLRKNATTNVTIEKLIMPNANNTGPKIVFRIKTPWVTKADFIFALDSSGSTFLTGDNVTIEKEVTNFIKGLNGIRYDDGTKIDGRVSILSWNDNVSFAYSDIANKDPDKAKMVPLSQALSDINAIFSNFKGYENNGTVFDVGLNNSIKILNNNLRSYAFKNITSKFIIFVTDRSEFTDIDKNILARARKMNYAIYPIGLNPGPMMKDSLTRMANQTNGYYGGWTASTTVDVDRPLADSMKNITQKVLYGTPVANDMIIVDSIYPYLTPDLSTIKGARLDGYYSNPDGTKTLKLYVGNLSPGNITEVSFDADINIDLPVDVTKSKSLFAYPVFNQTNESKISYKWYTGGNYTIELPEGKMNIRRGQVKTGKTQTGIESGIIAIFSLIGICILKGLKREQR